MNEAHTTVQMLVSLGCLFPVLCLVCLCIAAFSSEPQESAWLWRAGFCMFMALIVLACIIVGVGLNTGLMAWS